MSIDVRIEGLDRLRGALRQAPPELKKKMRSKLFSAGDIVRDEARRRIYSPGGHARRGIQTSIIETGLGDPRVLVKPGKGAAGRAAVFSQRTRSPGRTPPPMRAARAMAKRYGLPPEAARPLAIAIGRKGTKGRPVMVESLNATRSRVVARMKEAIDEIVAMAAGR